MELTIREVLFPRTSGPGELPIIPFSRAPCANQLTLRCCLVRFLKRRPSYSFPSL